MISLIPSHEVFVNFFPKGRGPGSSSLDAFPGDHSVPFRERRNLVLGIAFSLTLLFTQRYSPRFPSLFLGIQSQHPQEQKPLAPSQACLPGFSLRMRVCRSGRGGSQISAPAAAHSVAQALEYTGAGSRPGGSDSVLPLVSAIWPLPSTSTSSFLQGISSPVPAVPKQVGVKPLR